MSSLSIPKSIGIQLFSLPKRLNNDLPGTIDMLAQMGYTEVELFGPYPFSTDMALAEWEAITPYLGFSGSGFFGRTVREMHGILSQNGMSVAALHTDLDTLQYRMDKLGEAAQTLGTNYVVLPAIPEQHRQTMDDYRRMADTFNQIGESARQAGVRFAYHNHGYGLHEQDGQTPLQLLLDHTDPELVFLELDIYWTTAGGADPITLLDSYSDRYRLIHLKDMAEPVRFSGDGSVSTEWMSLFPYMTTLGNGVLNVSDIVAKAQAAGVEHFIVEQDLVADPDVSLRKSSDFLRPIG
ncbi:sugar phosphate isomerase/epimerase family protein [Spirosoma rhododendri]|uniref:Sugar phosphate isomerase/epimerase n=1 Tax=Spirosoma rhododendri TaxID=2728024 RepID=A0A7L5DJZ9_9BACT|nr:sugar phosphate isomerase/epimerase [Spirosoma rhododendri]QJD78784.1 sugar phosphate isomerase/epimerase [Spirosoma rhododendri]